MRSGVPFLFKGPTPSRFYFLGDHWLVEAGEPDVVAVLRRKEYTWWQFALSFLAIPSAIVILAAIVFVTTSSIEFFWAGVCAAFAAGLPMFYIQKTEQKQLERTPLETIVFGVDDWIRIQGKTYESSTISGLNLVYTYYQSTGAQGDAGYSELDIVFVEGNQEHRINLLSQTADWAGRHARKLQQLTGVQLCRNSVAR